MSVERAIGFEYNTLTEIDGNNGNISIISSDKRTGSYSLKLYCPVSEFGYWFTINLTARDEYYIQFAFNPQTVAPHYKFLRWQSGGTVLGGLRATGAVVEAYTGNWATLVGTGTTVMSTGTWQVMQVRVKIHDSEGVIQVRLGTSLEIDFTGDTKPGAETTINTLYFSAMGLTTNGTYFDDIVINNTLGSRNNSWPNGIPLYVIRPNAAGDYSQWTPSAGSNYQCVDETPPSVTDYVRPTATGQKDLYNFPDCPGAVNQISFIAGDYWGQAVGYPAITQFKRLVKTGGSEYEGSGRALENTFKNHQEFIELNPDDSQPWEPADINALQLGMTSLT